jgi:hypothetical protein
MQEGSVIIRLATPADRAHLRQAIIELQDYERLQHITRLPGDQVANAYLDWMLGSAESWGLYSWRIAILFSRASSPAGSSRARTSAKRRIPIVWDTFLIFALCPAFAVAGLLRDSSTKSSDILLALASHAYASIPLPKISLRERAMNALALLRTK